MVQFGRFLLLLNESVTNTELQIPVLMDSVTKGESIPKDQGDKRYYESN